jgi:hypothetical protein
VSSVRPRCVIAFTIQRGCPAAATPPRFPGGGRRAARLPSATPLPLGILPKGSAGSGAFQENSPENPSPRTHDRCLPAPPADQRSRARAWHDRREKEPRRRQSAAVGESVARIHGLPGKRVPAAPRRRLLDHFRIAMDLCRLSLGVRRHRSHSHPRTFGPRHRDPDRQAPRHDRLRATDIVPAPISGAAKRRFRLTFPNSADAGSERPNLPPQRRQRRRSGQTTMHEGYRKKYRSPPNR